MRAMVSIGSIFALFKSKMASDGFIARACSSTSSGVRGNVSSTPACLPVVRIFERNRKSSTATRIMTLRILRAAEGTGVSKSRGSRRRRLRVSAVGGSSGR